MLTSTRAFCSLLSGRAKLVLNDAHSSLLMQRCAVSTLEHGKDQNSTVDKSEVDQHSKLSQTWWSLHGPMMGLHAMNEIRVPFVRDGILGKSAVKSSTPLEGTKILDVGCGGGILSEPLARLGAAVTGVDASMELIDVATSHAKLDPTFNANNLKYLHTTIEEHAALGPEYYDAIVASEIIEHVTHKELFVTSCLKALKPGGSIFFTTPNRTNLSWLAGIILAENVLKVVPKGTHQHEKFITPTELSLLLEKHNCRTLAVYGGYYSLLKKTWSFSSNKDLLFLLHAVK